MTELLGIKLDTDLKRPEEVDLPELGDPDVADALARIAAAEESDVPGIEAALLEQSDNRGEDAEGFVEGDV